MEPKIYRLDELRQKMISIGLKKGLCSPEAVAISQELDKLIIKKMKGDN